MIGIHSRRSDDAAWLAGLVESSGVPVQMVEGFTSPRPVPARTQWVDRSAILKRKRPRISLADRRRLRHMVDML